MRLGKPSENTYIQFFKCINTWMYCKTQVTDIHTWIYIHICLRFGVLVSEKLDIIFSEDNRDKTLNE